MSTMTIDDMFRGARPARPRSAVRLTRRGRLVLVAIALLALLAIGLVLASGSMATDEPGTQEPTRVMTVGSGDTLWAIAADLADDGDVRAMIQRIEKLNALESGMVVLGQRLVVPTS